jgi:hypothetical protein
MSETILTPVQKDQLTQKLDELIQLKGFAEMIDGPTIKILLGLLDTLISNYIPPQYYPALREAVAGLLVK